MEKRLPIPYRSQEDSDADLASTDCGAACVAMILEAFGFQVTIDNIFNDSGKEPDEFLGRSDLVRAAKKYNVAMKAFEGDSFSNIKKVVDKRLSVIAMVNYAAWLKPDSGVSTQSTSFDKTHFVVIAGYDDDENVLIHDPLWWESRRHEGKYKKMTFDQFNAAWSTCDEYLDNPNNVGVITKKALPTDDDPLSSAASKVKNFLIRAWEELTG